MDQGIVKCQFLYKQVREIVLNVYLYFISLHEQTTILIGECKCDNATSQEKTAVSFEVSLHIIQRITREGNKCNVVLKSPPKKNHKKNKPDTGMNEMKCFMKRGV